MLLNQFCKATQIQVFIHLKFTCHFLGLKKLPTEKTYLLGVNFLSKTHEISFIKLKHFLHNTTLNTLHTYEEC